MNDDVIEFMEIEVQQYITQFLCVIELCKPEEGFC